MSEWFVGERWCQILEKYFSRETLLDQNLVNERPCWSKNFWKKGLVIWRWLTPCRSNYYVQPKHSKSIFYLCLVKPGIGKGKAKQTGLKKSTPPPVVTVVTYISYVLGTSLTLYSLYVLHYILLHVRIAFIECNIPYKILVVQDNYAAEETHNVTK